MRLSKAALAVVIAVALMLVLAACLQAPPAPAGDVDDLAAGPGIVRDLTVPGNLTAARATIRDSLTVNGAASVGSLAVRSQLDLTNAGISGFYVPLSLAGTITESYTLSDTISAALVPVDMTIESVGFFARAISNTVACNVLYTTSETTPTMNTILDSNVAIVAGDVVTATVDRGALGAGYQVELACETDAGGFARDVQVLMWLEQ